MDKDKLEKSSIWRIFIIVYVAVGLILSFLAFRAGVDHGRYSIWEGFAAMLVWAILPVSLVFIIIKKLILWIFKYKQK